MARYDTGDAGTFIGFLLEFYQSRSSPLIRQSSITWLLFWKKPKTLVRLFSACSISSIRKNAHVSLSVHAQLNSPINGELFACLNASWKAFVVTIELVTLFVVLTALDNLCSSRLQVMLFSWSPHSLQRSSPASVSNVMRQETDTSTWQVEEYLYW